jgi:hypothetical protein
MHGLGLDGIDVRVGEPEGVPVAVDGVDGVAAVAAAGAVLAVLSWG